MDRVEIVVDNIWGRITTRLPTEVLTYIANKTRYHPAGYDKTWNYKKGRWDGYNYTFDVNNQVFRAGLLSRICYCLDHFSIKYGIIRDSSRTNARTAEASLEPGVIRPIDFQTKIRQVVRDNERGIIASPTGTGKTVMVSLVIDELKRRTLVILNDLVLLDQMHRALGRYFPDAKLGYIGNTEFDLGDITVATIQSLRSIAGLQESKKDKGEHPNKQKFIDWLGGVGCIIHDEVHLADSDSCLLFYGIASATDRIYGFSATPYAWAEKQQSSANIELEQVFGKIIYSTFGLDFIELGLKVPCIVKQVELKPRVKAYGTFRDNQAELYKKALQFEIMQDPAWHHAVLESVREFTKDNMTCFVYAGHKLEYGETLAKMLGAPFVQGKTKRAERFRIFDAVESKQIPVIVSDIGGVGLDIPSLDAFVLASDVKDIRQFRGRVERSSPKTGKQFGHFVDIWKDCSFLNKHHTLRENQYKEGGNIIL
mgnify:CR=1 FL=1